MTEKVAGSIASAAAVSFLSIKRRIARIWWRKRVRRIWLTRVRCSVVRMRLTDDTVLAIRVYFKVPLRCGSFVRLPQVEGEAQPEVSSSATRHTL